MTKIIIEGITPDGKPFRPSDWAERLCGALSTFRGRRIHYDDRLVPIINDAGNKCVAIDLQLKDTNPELYDSFLEFADYNQLRVYQDNI